MELHQKKAPAPRKQQKVTETADGALKKQSQAKLKGIGKFIVEIKENDPFFGTKLVVFSDGYTGLLPLNGVKESELKKAKKFYFNFLNMLINE